MPPRRKLPRRKRGRTWRAGSHPDCSVLSKGRRSKSRRASRFSPLPPWRPEPELSPLHKIPTFRAWLAARAKMPRNVIAARTAS